MKGLNKILASVAVAGSVNGCVFDDEAPSPDVGEMCLDHLARVELDLREISDYMRCQVGATLEFFREKFMLDTDMFPLDKAKVTCFPWMELFDEMCLEAMGLRTEAMNNANQRCRLMQAYSRDEDSESNDPTHFSKCLRVMNKFEGEDCIVEASYLDLRAPEELSKPVRVNNNFSKELKNYAKELCKDEALPEEGD